ncbi:hypothetical protein QOZ80_7AG0554080 [Eleusine coracana subsp. coracana]|nr:hypothetical protein QOZ80_7AG0554080 [Eleusine coracana subsp. coracana]
MAEMVVSSVVQEGMNRMSSYISGKLEEKELRENSIARLEMALSQLEFALERTAEWPITYVYISLIRRRMVLKQVYKEGTDLLKKLQLQVVEGGEQIGQWVTGSSFLQWISHAINLPILSFIGLRKENIISSTIVQKFEWYADCADKFVTDVESVCPLRHDIFRYPLERQLLEGKSLMYNIKKGSQRYGITMWPVCSEERGIEVMLQYNYVDLNKMQANEVDLNLTLRLSQGTDMVGTAIRCLQFVTESFKLSASPFKFVMECMIGEMNLLSNTSLQDIPRAFPFLSKECFVKKNILDRPDPICCTSNVVSSELSHAVPEPVVSICFSCSTSALEYMVHSSTDEVLGPNSPLLRLNFSFMPHTSMGPQRILGAEFEGKLEHMSGSIMQLMEDLLESRKCDFLARHPKSAKYNVCWSSPHGAALISLEKLRRKKISPALANSPSFAISFVTCPEPTSVSIPRRRTAKRRKR